MSAHRNAYSQEEKNMDTSILESIVLKYGGHASREEGVCAMEAVAWLAGEPHSDRPACTCSVIGRLVVRLNDRIGRGEQADALRTRILRPLLPKLVGTAATREVRAKRAYLATDAAVRIFAARALDEVGMALKRPELEAEAQKLRALPPVVDGASAKEAEAAARAARKVSASFAAATAADAAAASAAAAAAAADDAAAAAASAASAAAADDAASAYAAAYAAAAAASAAADAADAADAAYAASARQKAARNEARERCYVEWASLIERLCAVRA